MGQVFTKYSNFSFQEEKHSAHWDHLNSMEMEAQKFSYGEFHSKLLFY